MAIVWADFPSGQQGIYGTDRTIMLNGVWAGFSEDTGTFRLVDDPDPNIGADGKVLRVVASSSGGSPDRIARIVNPAGAQATTGMGFRLWMESLPLGDLNQGNPQWYFRTDANSDVVVGRVLANGGVGVYSNAGTLLGQTTVPVITANAYSHIETKVVRDATEGTVEIRVNGVVRLTLTGLALGASNIGIQGIGCEGGSGGALTSYYKDFVYWDGTGTEGNDFQGSVAVRDLYPDADIALNWTPSTGATGWNLIDETTPNDADYIQAGDPPPDPAKFSLTNLPDDVTSVRALIPIYRAVKTDGGDCNLQVGLTPNDTNWDDGADRPITTAFTYWWDVSALSPATSAPWTPVEVNAAYVRVDRTL